MLYSFDLASLGETFCLIGFLFSSMFFIHVAEPVCQTDVVNVVRFSSANCTQNASSGCEEPVWNSNFKLTTWDILVGTSRKCVGAYRITADGLANGYGIVKSKSVRA